MLKDRPWLRAVVHPGIASGAWRVTIESYSYGNVCSDNLGGTMPN